jgi:hypothetical protein
MLSLMMIKACLIMARTMSGVVVQEILDTNSTIEAKTLVWDLPHWQLMLLAAGYVVASVLIVHAVLAYKAGAECKLARASGCTGCCFDGRVLCRCSFWWWHPISLIMRLIKRTSRLCPLRFEQTIPPKHAMREISDRCLAHIGILLASLAGTFIILVGATLRFLGLSF